MTYIGGSLAKRVNAKCNIYHTASATIANGEPITYASEDTTFGINFNLSRTGSQFTIPNDGATYYLEASICYYYTTTVGNHYAIIQWYDLTNSSYVGTKGFVSPGLNWHEGRVGDIVADEAARHVTSQPDNFELRLLTTTGQLTAVDTPMASASGANAYYTRSRCLIWRHE